MTRELTKLIAELKAGKAPTPEDAMLLIAALEFKERESKLAKLKKQLADLGGRMR